MKYSDANKIIKFADELDGVFTMPDLKVLFSERTDAALYKKLVGLIEEKLLVKVMRGLYAVPETSLDIISARIYPDSYISTGTVLARNMVIGSIPAYKLQAVKVGRPRVYEFDMGIIEFLSIAPELFFGFTLFDGIKYASAEKAFIDTCYYQYKGRRFSFDIDSDVNKDSLNSELISKYLTKYDKRFVCFFNKLWRL